MLRVKRIRPQATIPTTVLLLAALLATLLLAAPAYARNGSQDGSGGGDAMVRVAHLSSDATAVDVYVDGEPVEDLTGLRFEAVSPYVRLPAGTHDVKVYATGDTPNGGSAPLVEANLDLSEGAAYTAGVIGMAADGSLAAQVYEDDLSPPARGKARVRVVHAVPDVAEVDVSASGGPSLFTDLGFPNATRYAEVPAGTYTFEAKPAGKEAVAFTMPNGTFSAGAVYSAFVVGQARGGAIEVVVAEYVGRSAGEQGTTLLPIVAHPGIVPLRGASSSVPQTGGLRLALLLLPAALALPFLAFCAAILYGGRRSQWDRVEVSVVGDVGSGSGQSRHTCSQSGGRREVYGAGAAKIVRRGYQEEREPRRHR